MARKPKSIEIKRGAEGRILVLIEGGGIIDPDYTAAVDSHDTALAYALELQKSQHLPIVDRVGGKA